MEAATENRPGAATAPAAARAPVTVRPRATPRELLLCAAALAVLGWVAFGGNVTGAVFLMDDWSNSAFVQYPGDQGVLSLYWDVTSYRPVLVPYVPLTHWVFGEEAWLHNGYALLLRVAMSLAVFALLRTLGMRALAAFAVAALLLLFPSSDSAVLWSTASMAHLTVTLGICGALVAVHGIRTGRGLGFHALAVALYAVSLLAYEVIGPLVVFTFALYRTQTGWRDALRRWGIDMGVLALCLAWVGTQTTREKHPLDEQIDHARMIADEGLDILARSAAPMGSLGRQTILAALALCVAAAVVVWRLLPRGDADRAALARWLVTGAAGVVVAAAGWAMYVPADAYYSPGTMGLGNRVNVVAAIGIVLVLVSVAALAGRLAFRGLPRGELLAGIAAGAYLAVIGAGYLDDDRTAVDNYREAYRGEEEVLAAIETGIGDPVSDSAIFTFNQPLYQGPGIPVFASSWDLNGAVKVHYDDPGLRGVPVGGGWRVECAAEGVRPLGGGWETFQPAPYGKAYFVDVGARHAVLVTSRAQCARELPAFPPGPEMGPVDG